MTSLAAIGEGRYQKVRLDDLITDGRFNRLVRQSHVERIASDFTPAAFGVIELWQREDGTLVILDGQHRCAMLRLLGYPADVKCAPALVHAGLTLDQAAELFVKLNASKLVNAYDRFHALLTATHTRTCDIDRIVRASGLRVSAGKTDGTISAVDALDKVYGLGEPEGAVLAKALRALGGAWGEASEAFASPILRGVALYFHQHRDSDPDALATALVRGPGAPINLVGWAKVLVGSQRMHMDEAIATTIEKRVMVTRRSVKAAASS